MTPSFRSLCLATDAIAMTGLVTWEETATHVILRTPSEPTYWYGNCVILRQGVIDLDTQLGLFRAAFPDARHTVLQWDAPDIDPQPHLAALAAEGFETDLADVLTSPGPPLPAPLPDEFTIRQVTSDEDWAQVTTLQHEIGVEDGHPADAHLSFVTHRYANTRRQMEAGLGARFAVFDGPLLVADMGVVMSDTLIRYQNVATRQSHRRRGLCAALLAHTGAWAQSLRPSATQVIVADPTGDAGRIYRRSGFARTEGLFSIVKSGY